MHHEVKSRTRRRDLRHRTGGIGVLAGLSMVGLSAASMPPAAAATTVVDSPAELAEAFQDISDLSSNIVVLGADIVVPATGPAIGVPTGRTVDLQLAGHRLEVTGVPEAAGIGVPSTAHLVISDDVGGGSLIATSQDDGAGIGGDRFADGGFVSINSGVVTATSQGHGAGIGGGDGGAFEGVAIQNGTTTATSIGDGAGIGGGRNGDGGLVGIATGADVTAESRGSGNGVGPGAGGHGFGPLDNAGSLTILQKGPLIIPADADVLNRGTLAGTGGFGGDGEINNLGAIRATLAVQPTVTVSGNNYLLTFDANGGEGEVPDDLRVYAPTLAAAGLVTPEERPTQTGFTFQGWYDEDENPLDDYRVLGEADGPRTIAYQARWWPTAEAPTLTGAETASFVVGEAATYVPIVRGFPAPTVTAEGLPDGLEIDPATYLITGVPAEGSEGTHVVVLTASNGVEPDATLTVTFEISPVPVTSFELDVSPREASAGDRLLISGSGLPQGVEVGLELASEPVELGTASVDAQGRFELTATVPDGTVPGDHQVVATATVRDEVLTESAGVRILPVEAPPSDDPTPDDTDPDDDGEENLPDTGSGLPIGLLIGAAALLLAGVTIVQRYSFSSSRPRR